MATDNGYTSFVVRVWLDKAHRIRRGHIRHTSCERMSAFNSEDLDRKILQFIRAHLRAPEQHQEGTDP